MRKFSWHTSKVKYEGNGCYVTNKVHHALTNFAYSECVEHYRPNMKGGHTHNHIYNVCNRILFRSKNVRQIDPTHTFLIFSLRKNRKPPMIAHRGLFL